jgi:hypothetical protein
MLEFWHGRCDKSSLETFRQNTVRGKRVLERVTTKLVLFLRRHCDESSLETFRQNTVRGKSP